MLRNFWATGRSSDRSEEYIINRKAMTALGFGTPEEAVGQPLEIRQGALDYINSGVIAGVSEDYSYTGVFEESLPLIMLHRNLFQFCLMVRIDTSDPDARRGRRFFPTARATSCLLAAYTGRCTATSSMPVA